MAQQPAPGGLATATLSVTLQRAAPCTVDAVAVTTECKPVMTVGTGVPPLGQTYQFDIKLLNYASPLPLYDPVIIQVPSTMSNFAGSIAVGPPGIAPGTPFLIHAGPQSIPIDANTTFARNFRRSEVAPPAARCCARVAPGVAPATRVRS